MNGNGPDYFHWLCNDLNGSHETLCSYCGKATNGGCCWSEKLEPVSGWKAVENARGWFVQSCPEYVSDEHIHDFPHELDDNGCVMLLEAMLRQMREDYVLMPEQRSKIEMFIRRPDVKHLFFFTTPDVLIQNLRKAVKRECRTVR